MKGIRELQLFLAILVFIFIIVNPVKANTIDEELFKKIESNLMCTDGCGMYLRACDNATAQKMRQEIRRMLSDGMSEKQIYIHMIDVYGEGVMAAPPPSIPFNITAWITPFLAVAGGGLAIYTFVYKRVNCEKNAMDKDLEKIDTDLPEYEKLVEDEFKKYV